MITACVVILTPPIPPRHLPIRPMIIGYQPVQHRARTLGPGPEPGRCRAWSRVARGSPAGSLGSPRVPRDGQRPRNWPDRRPRSRRANSTAAVTAPTGTTRKGGAEKANRNEASGKTFCRAGCHNAPENNTFQPETMPQRCRALITRRETLARLSL